LQLYEESKKNEIARKKSEIDNKYKIDLEDSIKMSRDTVMKKDFERSALKDLNKD